MRIGIGHDTHQLEVGGPLRLGGVTIPHDRHLVGHSDADALLHALTDALLGAAGLGDIGDWFPDSDPRRRGMDSAVMLQQAWREVRQAGWGLVNADCIVFAQRPVLGPHKAAIAQRMAELLEVDARQLSVKAKTGEHVGPVGREEALCTQCVVLLQPTDAASAATETT